MGYHFFFFKKLKATQKIQTSIDICDVNRRISSVWQTYRQNEGLVQRVPATHAEIT